MEWLLRILEGLFIGVGVPLCFYLLARFFPFKPQIPPQGTVSFDELKSKYNTLLAASTIPFFVFWVVGGYLVFQSLVWISHQSLPDGHENSYLMLPDQYVFLFPTVFFGLYLGMIPGELFLRLKLKEKYAEYTLYVNLLHGYDTWKVVKVLSVVIMTPCALFTILAMDCYARITNDQIITNRFLGFGETAHNYNQVSRIKSARFKAPPGDNGGESPYHIVYFNDGSIWSTRDVLYRSDQIPKLSHEKEREIFAFIAMKCGKEIEQYDFLNKDEDR